MSFLGLRSSPFWTSGYNLPDGIWRWTATNRIMTYTNWYPGQPDGDLGVQPFSDINWDGNGRWDNEFPQATHYAVCESNQN